MEDFAKVEAVQHQGSQVSKSQQKENETEKSAFENVAIVRTSMRQSVEIRENGSLRDVSDQLNKSKTSPKTNLGVTKTSVDISGVQSFDKGPQAMLKTRDLEDFRANRLERRRKMQTDFANIKASSKVSDDITGELRKKSAKVPTNVIDYADGIEDVARPEEPILANITRPDNDASFVPVAESTRFPDAAEETASETEAGVRRVSPSLGSEIQFRQQKQQSSSERVRPVNKALPDIEESEEIREHHGDYVGQENEVQVPQKHKSQENQESPEEVEEPQEEEEEPQEEEEELQEEEEEPQEEEEEEPQEEEEPREEVEQPQEEVEEFQAEDEEAQEEEKEPQEEPQEEELLEEEEEEERQRIEEEYPGSRPGSFDVVDERGEPSVFHANRKGSFMTIDSNILQRLREIGCAPVDKDVEVPETTRARRQYKKRAPRKKKANNKKLMTSKEVMYHFQRYFGEGPNLSIKGRSIVVDVYDRFCQSLIENLSEITDGKKRLKPKDIKDLLMNRYRMIPRSDSDLFLYHKIDQVMTEQDKESLIPPPTYFFKTSKISVGLTFFV